MFKNSNNSCSTKVANEKTREITSNIIKNIKIKSNKNASEQDENINFSIISTLNENYIKKKNQKIIRCF